MLPDRADASDAAFNCALFSPAFSDTSSSETCSCGSCDGSYSETIAVSCSPVTVSSASLLSVSALTGSSFLVSSLTGSSSIISSAGSLIFSEASMSPSPVCSCAITLTGTAPCTVPNISAAESSIAIIFRNRFFVSVCINLCINIPPFCFALFADF